MAKYAPMKLVCGLNLRIEIAMPIIYSVSGQDSILILKEYLFHIVTHEINAFPNANYEMLNIKSLSLRNQSEKIKTECYIVVTF